MLTAGFQKYPAIVQDDEDVYIATCWLNGVHVTDVPWSSCMVSMHTMGIAIAINGVYI